MRVASVIKAGVAAPLPAGATRVSARGVPGRLSRPRACCRGAQLVERTSVSARRICHAPVVRASLLWAVLALSLTSCSDSDQGASSDPSPSGGSSSGAAVAEPTVPDGDVVPRTTGAGSRDLGAVRVPPDATVFFQCTLGEGARVHYGDSSQLCPGQAAVLAIEVDPADSLPLSVTGSAATEWAISVARTATGGSPSD